MCLFSVEGGADGLKKEMGMFGLWLFSDDFLCLCSWSQLSDMMKFGGSLVYSSCCNSVRYQAHTSMILLTFYTRMPF